MKRCNVSFQAWVVALSAVVAMVWSAPAHGQSHEYIMMMRSSTQHHVFVSQSAEGTYGSFRKSVGDPSNAALISSGNSGRSVWQGYDLRTAVGLELMKFVNFSVAHNSVNMRSKDDAQESMNGSKLSGEAKLAFISPMGNLEFGGAVTGSRYDYQKQLDTGGYYGSGYYYLIGWNYYMTYNVSVFGTAKIVQEHLVPNGGAQNLSTMDTDMSALGGGFTLWL